MDKQNEKCLTHFALGLLCNEVTEISLNGQHVFANFVEHHHIKRYPKQSKENTEDLSIHSVGTDISITYGGSREKRVYNSCVCVNQAHEG